MLIIYLCRFVKVRRICLDVLIKYKGLVLSGPGCTNTIYPMLSFSNDIVCFMLCSGRIDEQPITSYEH